MTRVAMSLVLAVILTAVVLLTAACGGDPKNSIVLYNGQHLALTRAMISAFEEQTGISVRTRSSSGVVLADLLLQEGDSSPADVFLTENSPELMNLEEHGRLATLDPSVLRQVPPQYSSPQGKWAGVALRVSSLACNESLLSGSRLPKSIIDLAGPQWKDKIAVAPLDGDFLPVVGAVISTHGEKAAAAWMKGLKRNAEIYADAEAVVAAVNRGDVACGVVNSYYWYRLRRELGADRMHSAPYYFPSSDVGSVVNIAGAGVLASARHPEDAERFVEFMLSPEGQQLISQTDDFEYPARPGVAANSALPPLESIPHASLSVVDLGNNKLAAALIARTGFGT